MFIYREVLREKYFVNEYPYKIYFNFNVRWSKEKTIWFNKEHQKEMDGIIRCLNIKFPKRFKQQGAVIYCSDLDVAFYLKMIHGEKIKIIEKAILSEEERGEKDFK